MSNHLLSIQKLTPADTAHIPGYFVVSTAPINVEDQPPVDPHNNPYVAIAEMTQYLRAHEDNAEIVIVIHGYNTPKSGVEDWYKKACAEISQRYTNLPKGLIILGYRWPSEQVTEDESGKFAAKRKFAQQSLPVLLRATSRLGTGGGIVGAIVSLVALVSLIWHGSSALSAIAFGLLIIAGLLLIGSAILVSPILTLVMLRLSVYFRDSFRASNYGVADLVELIRQLDNSLVEQVEQVEQVDRSAQIAYWQPKRIRLSFIGHSMGAFVVTNAVRVLSDVFDRNSIGSLDANNQKKSPSSAIGNVFALGRLVLVAPDIPAESIISGRANTLRSSLRRFEEAYLFSNEGDMALRLASTTANYFTFPTRTRDGGYRLGNVSVRAADEAIANKSGLIEKLGIVNQDANGRLLPQPYLDYLYIRRSKPLSARQDQMSLSDREKPIAELFTYFDCTNYQEEIRDATTGETKKIGIVSQALGQRSLSTKDYFALTMDFFAGKIDPHGGYIFNPNAQFSKQAIYGLACLGFEGFLDSLQRDPLFPSVLADMQHKQPHLVAAQQVKLAALQMLSQRCADRGIQVLLAPERYQVNVLGQAQNRDGY
jgi:Alpha/beta hydrolase of unknown function (DUF900)